MNTILITGTAKNISSNHIHEVEYNVMIWGAQSGQDISVITYFNERLIGYGALWSTAKKKAVEYFNNPRMEDGAYTNMLEHITIIE